MEFFGLIVIGIILNSSVNRELESESKSGYEKIVENYNSHYLNSYTTNLLENNVTKLNGKINNNFNKSIHDKYLVNKLWREDYGQSETYSTKFDTSQNKFIYILLTIVIIMMYILYIL